MDLLDTLRDVGAPCVTRDYLCGVFALEICKNQIVKNNIRK